MCGIAGVVGAAQTQPQHVASMVEKIRYRGIDESGMQAVQGRAIMGQARRKIVDVHGGQQPMSTPDGKVWVVFNGEIYNFVELREELEAKGYNFHTKCDTEILLHLWREEGEAMLQKLIGMFAFFIWDEAQDKGMLARDRQGIKPCFVAEYKGGLAFCSEIKGLFALPGLEPEINPAGLKNVFAFNYCPPPQTCFAGITHLEPGTYLLFEGSKKPQQKRYWRWPFEQEKRTPGFEEFEALLDDVVRIQMRFDVAGGMYLSGGVDSGVVAYHLKQQWNAQTLPAYGLNFPNQEFSEFSHAQRVADLLDIDLEEVKIMPDMIPDIASKVSYHAEQPHGDFSFFLFYLLAQRTQKNGQIVMFTGDGPDESMGGQHFHNQPAPDFVMRDYYNTICYMPEDMRSRVLCKEFGSETPDPYEHFMQMLEPFAALDPVDKIAAYESGFLLPGNNVLKGERMSSAFSLEIRSPMLDHRVSEVFTRLPPEQKFAEGFSKYYLKKYAVTKLPHDHIFKKKSMPTLPIGEWIKQDLYDWAHALLSRADERIMNRDSVLKVLAEHKRGEHNHTRALRTLIMTQLWIEQSVGIGAQERPKAMEAMA